MRFITIAVSLGSVYGCSSSPLHPEPISPSIRSISQTSVTAGSSDVTLTLIGTNFVDGFPVNTFAMWSANGVNTPLATRFVSATELSAVIPARLLTEPAEASVFVETGDSTAVSEGFAAYAKSSLVRFDVRTPSRDLPSI